jgi:hypothetical protein
MLDIYRGAAHVIVWLGPASDLTAEAIECLEKLSMYERIDGDSTKRNSADVALSWFKWVSYYAGLLVAIPLWTVIGTIRARDITTYIWIATRTGLTGKFLRAICGGRTLWIPLWGLWARLINAFMYYSLLSHWWKIYVNYDTMYEHLWFPTDADVHALKDYFDRDWFRRIWIVQEINVARKATVLCGRYAVEWEVVVQAVTYMEREVNRSRSRHPYIDTDYDFASILTDTYSKLRLHGDPDHEMGMLHHLSRFCYYKATIAHDKAYALLGLCAEVQEQTGPNVVLEPRYDKPAEYAFADLVRYSIESTQQLDILRACTGHRMSPHMPTWVPDWRIAEQKDHGGSIRWETRYTLPEPTDPPMPIAEFSADLKSIHVRGVIIGHLTNAGEDEIMINMKTRVLGNMPSDMYKLNIKTGYLMLLFALLARTGVLYWLAKFIARRIASRFRGTIFEDFEELIDVIATDIKEKNPMRNNFWKLLYQFWKIDIPLTHDVPRFPESTGEVENWNRSCRWKAVPELGLLPLVVRVSRINISADVPHPGDTVCMMLGSTVPYILRDNDGFYELIGYGKLDIFNSYVWKAVVKAYQAGNIKFQEFIIR